MVFYDSLAMKTFFVGWCHHYKFLLICTEIIKHVSPRYGISLFIEWMVLTTWLSTEMEITFLCLFINQLLLLSSLLSLSTLVKPDYYMLFLLFYYFFFIFYYIIYIFIIITSGCFYYYYFIHVYSLEWSCFSAKIYFPVP